MTALEKVALNETLCGQMSWSNGVKYLKHLSLCLSLMLKINLMKIVVANVLNEKNVSLQEDEANDFSNDASNERLEDQEKEGVSLNLRHLLNATFEMQRLLEVLKHLSMVPNCLNGEECGRFEDTLSSLIFEFEKALPQNVRQTTISEFWSATPQKFK